MKKLREQIFVEWRDMPGGLLLFESTPAMMSGVGALFSSSESF
jgi:hypothetical protein